MITKEQFEAYVRVQKSGVTNMFAIKVVMELTGLTKEEVLTIMRDYEKLSEKFAEGRA